MNNFHVRYLAQLPTVVRMLSQRNTMRSHHSWCLLQLHGNLSEAFYFLADRR